MIDQVPIVALCIQPAELPLLVTIAIVVRLANNPANGTFSVAKKKLKRATISHVEGYPSMRLRVKTATFNNAYTVQASVATDAQ
ncbi:MAG: hypothetical protein JWQ40_4986 [Segetibacter sp.]|jgi:hypothetical protein|nr:hypothetical protein [Segetibacter sp.]